MCPSRRQSREASPWEPLRTHRGRPVMVPAAARGRCAVPHRGTSRWSACRDGGGSEASTSVARVDWHRLGHGGAAAPWPKPLAPDPKHRPGGEQREHDADGGADAAQPPRLARQAAAGTPAAGRPRRTAPRARRPVQSRRADLRGRRLEGIETGGERRERLAARLVAPAGEPALQLAEMGGRRDRRQRPLARPAVGGRRGARVAEQRRLQERVGPVRRRDRRSPGRPRETLPARRAPAPVRMPASGGRRPAPMGGAPSASARAASPAMAARPGTSGRRGRRNRAPPHASHAQRAPSRHRAGECLLVRPGPLNSTRTCAARPDRVSSASTGPEGLEATAAALAR